MAAEQCSRCGVNTIDGAKYCHGCGAPVKLGGFDEHLFAGDPHDFATVEPDRPVPSRFGVILAVGAAVALGAIGIGFFGDDSALPPDGTTPARADPPPSRSAAVEAEAPEQADAEGTENSSTDTSAGESLGPLSWLPGIELVEGWPLGFVDWDGSTLFFARSARWQTDPGQSGGLLAWATDNGDRWEPLGEVIPRAQVNAVAAGPRGLLAVGVDQNGEPTLWTGTDPAEWTAHRLPSAGDGGRLAVPGTVVSTDRLVVVASGVGFTNPFDKLIVAVQAETGLARPLIAELGLGSRPVRVRAEGPFGLPILDTTAERLGLSEADIEALGGSPAPPALTVWASLDSGATWSTGTVAGLHVTELVATDDGAVVMAGWPTVPGASGPLISSDGESWEPFGSVSLQQAARWGDQIIGLDDLSRLTIGSPQGTDRIDTDSILGTEREAYAVGIAAGDRGIAVSFQVLSVAGPVELATTATLIRGDYRLTATTVGQAGALRLHRGDRELATVSLSRDADRHLFEIDAAGRAVSFVDPVDGERYVTFAWDELAQLEADVSPPYPPPGYTIAFSADSKEWSINDLVDFAPGATSVLSSHVGDRFIHLAVSDRPVDLRYSPTNRPTHTITIYSAQLPPR